MTPMVKAHITHCLRGHEYTAENTSWSTGNSGKPQRSCKACKSVRYRAEIEKINAAYVDFQQKRCKLTKLDVQTF